MLFNKSVLVIGATGLSGKAILDALASHETKPEVHAMVRDPTKLSGDKRLESIIKGDARSKDDIEAALEVSGARWVVICVGNGLDLSKTNNIRATNAAAVASVLQKPAFRHVRALVLSSHGAGPTKMVIGYGMGKAISFYYRHVFKDHTEQEKALSPLKNRLTVVRPTGLTVDMPTGHLVSFGNKEKCPTIETDRADLAAWIANEICGSPVLPNGGSMNVTGVKK